MDANFFELIIFFALISFIAINFKIILTCHKQRKLTLFDLEAERQNTIEYHLKKGDYAVHPIIWTQIMGCFLYGKINERTTN